MKKFILLICSVLFLAGCHTSSLNLDKSNELILGYNNNSYMLSSQVLSSKFLNYKDLFINQYMLKDKNGRVLFFEDLETSVDFEFNYKELYTLLYIFDTTKYEMFYQDENLTLLQVKLKNKKYVNVILESNDTQEISYVYGFSNEDFRKIALKLQTKKDDKLPELKENIVFLNDTSKPLTKWSSDVVYLTPLITPVRYQGGFF